MEIQPNWLGTQYHVVRHNCNTFTKYFIGFLLEEDFQLPDYVNRVDRLLRTFPDLVAMISDRYISPIALEETLAKDAGDQEEAVSGMLGKGCSKVKMGKRGKAGKGGAGAGKVSAGWKWRGKEGGKSASKNAGALLPIFEKVATRVKNVPKEDLPVEEEFEATDE